MTKLSKIREGDVLIADDGFDCMEAGEYRVCSDRERLYVACERGCHYLDGQVGGSGKLIGLRLKMEGGQEVIDVTKELIDLARNVGGLDDDWLGSRTPLEVWSLIREYRVQARKILDQIE